MKLIQKCEQHGYIQIYKQQQLYMYLKYYIKQIYIKEINDIKSLYFYVKIYFHHHIVIEKIYII